MTTSSLHDIEFVVNSIAKTAVDNEQYFCDLDSVVGDGDFGYSLARGFEKIISDWETYPRDHPSKFLQQIAVTITSRIGGTSGPIWGTAFLRAATSIRGTSYVHGRDVVTMLRAAIEGMKERGRSDVGDKTLLDALVPAVDALERSVTAGAPFDAAVTAMATTARESAEATSSMIAKRGRASYSGERSIGSPDAGAIAIAVVLENLASQAPAKDEPTN